MNLAGAKEQDVREEVAAPLLSSLGYQRGTENDILREVTLTHDRVFLGRKKKNDPPLRGRADYILAVTGAARWVLEVKAPHEEISQEVADQALSYARHPQISAAYAVILNGYRLVVFHYSQTSSEAPILDLAVTSLDHLALLVSGVLSPSAIRRDCSPPIVDTNLPLADGFRSTATIKAGVIAYSGLAWESNLELPATARAELDEMARRMSTYRTPIIGGRVWRDETSRIKAKLDWVMPHDEMMRFARDKRLKDIEYVSLNSVVSGDPDRPAVFDAVGGVTVKKGEVLFDMLRWDTKMAGIDCAMTYRGQATGYMSDGVFVGEFQAEYEASFPAFPIIKIDMFAMGKFEVQLDRR